MVLTLCPALGLAGAADPPPELWQAMVGGVYCDAVSSLQEVAPGRIVGVGSINTGGFGGSDYWMFITDTNDGSLNDLRFGGAGTEGVTSLVVAENGTLLLAGTSGSVSSGNKTAPLLGAWDFWVIKLNADFSVAWQQTYGGPGFDSLYQAVALEGDRFLLAGEAVNLSPDRPGAGVYLVCIDGTGAVLWDRFYASERPARKESLVSMAGGGVMLATRTALESEPGILLRALDAQGDTTWGRSLSNVTVELVALQGACPDGFVLAGTTFNTDPYNYFGYWAMRLDAAGQTLWERTYHGNGGADVFAAVRCLPDGGLLLGGSSYSGHGFDKTGYPYGEYDFWIVRTDAHGQPVWDLVYGSSAEEQLRSMALTSDGGFLLTGDVDANYYDVTDRGDRTAPDYGCWDVWVVRFGAESIPPGELDSDADGVPDLLDQCPDSPVGPVDDHGCGLFQLCPPPETSKDRGKYLQCVVTTLRRWTEGGRISRSQARDLWREAVRIRRGSYQQANPELNQGPPRERADSRERTR